MTSQAALRVAGVCLIWFSAMRLFAQQADNKLPLPDAKAQAEVMKLIKEVYGSEISAAKMPDQKRTLATKLLEKSKESEQDKAAYFVMLRLAKENAVLGFDAATALRAIDEIDKLFQCDVSSLQLEALTKTGSGNIPPPLRRELVQLISDVTEKALLKDQFQLAKQFNELGLSEARKTSDAALVKRFSDRKAEIEQALKGAENVQQALVKLDKSPTDPEANLIVGRYKCLMRGDWDAGLPMLALASDANLKSLALQELKKPAVPAEQAKLGDDWWELSKEQTGPAKLNLQMRAALWYQNALPQLQGLAKTKVEKRLEEVRAAVNANRKPIDALSRIDPKKNRLVGDWELVKAGLGTTTSNTNPICHLEIPIELGTNYELETEFTCVANTREIWMVLPIDGKHFALVVGSPMAGLIRVNGVLLEEQNPTMVKLPILEKNRAYKLRCKVVLNDADDTVTVKAELNGKKLVDYTGAESSLAFGIVNPRPGCAAIGAFSGSVLFQTVKALPEISLPTAEGKIGSLPERVAGQYLILNHENAMLDRVSLSKDFTVTGPLLNKSTWKIDGNLIVIEVGASSPYQVIFRWSDKELLPAQLRGSNGEPLSVNLKRYKP